jgi:hypothetical protein
VDSWTLEEPDGLVYIEQWFDSLECDGGGKPVAVVTNGQSGHCKGYRGDGGYSEGNESPIINKCNKTLHCIDIHAAMVSTPTRQLFLESFSPALSGTTPKLRAMEEDIALQEREATKKTARIDALRSGYEAAIKLRIQESDKWISWSPVTKASYVQGSYDGAPPLHSRGTSHTASGKQVKLVAQLQQLNGTPWQLMPGLMLSGLIWRDPTRLRLLRMLSLGMNLMTTLMEHLS